MQTVGCCGLGTDLPGVACAIIHDSDWNPRADLQVRSHEKSGDCLTSGRGPLCMDLAVCIPEIHRS